MTISTNVAGTGFADVADATGVGKAVYIGQNAGANSNTLHVDGRLIANVVNIGADGNYGNALVFGAESTNDIVTINLAAGNWIGIESIDGSEADYGDLVQTISGTIVSVVMADGTLEAFLAIAGDSGSIAKATELLYKWHDAAAGITYFGTGMVPEPATYAAVLGAAIVGYALVRRRRSATARAWNALFLP